MKLDTYVFCYIFIYFVLCVWVCVYVYMHLLQGTCGGQLSSISFLFLPVLKITSWTILQAPEKNISVWLSIWGKAELDRVEDSHYLLFKYFKNFLSNRPLFFLILY